MHDEPSSHDAELTGLEAQLAALSPAARIDRDRVMYAAGRRAGSRRLRVTNRFLTASNVLLGGLLAIVLAAPGWIYEPVAGPALDAPNVAEHDQPAVATVVANDDVSDTSLVLLDGPTNFRLLKLLGNDLDAHFEQPTDRDTPPETDHRALERSYPRTLLNRYLDGKPGRM